MAWLTYYLPASNQHEGFPRSRYVTVHLSPLTLHCIPTVPVSFVPCFTFREYSLLMTPVIHPVVCPLLLTVPAIRHTLNLIVDKSHNDSIF
jgi:hypothetical protein